MSGFGQFIAVSIRRATVPVVGVLALVGVLAATSVETPAQDASDAKAEDSGPLVQSLALDPVDKDVRVAGDNPKLANRLATIESEIARGWTLHYSGKAEESKGAFTNAMGTLITMRRELIELDGINPMVRMRNLRTGRFEQSARAETLRPFTAYMNAWISRLPEIFQNEMERRFGSEARAWLRSAIAAQSAPSLRDLAETHFFTDAGMAALDRLVTLGMESGDFLDVASWLLALREARPNVWRGSATHAFRLMVSLSALGDDELFDPVSREAKAMFPSATMIVGGQELPMMEAMQRVQGMLPKRGKVTPTPFKGFGESVNLPLASRTEYGAFSIEDSGPDQDDWFGWGWTPTLPTEYHMQPLFTSDGGIVAPRLLSGAASGESWYLWFPGASSDAWRALSMSEALRYKTPVVTRSNRNRWYYRAQGPELPFQRVFGMAEGAFRLAPSGSLPDGREVKCLVACMNSGRSTSSVMTGNQIHIFDTMREGALVMSLPLESQVLPGLAMQAALEKEDEVGAGGPAVPRPAAENAAAEDAEEEEDNAKNAAGERLSTAELGALLSRTHFSGVPIIDDGRLYIGGSVSNRATTEFRVFCFDLTGGVSGTPGVLMWQSRVSSVKGVMDYWSSRSKVREAGTLTKSGNRIFATSNHGSVACLDGRDGALQWVVVHRLRGTRDRSGNLFGRVSHEERPLMRPTAPELVGTTLVTAPSDGIAGFSMDGCSGTVFTPMLHGEREYELANYALGTHGGRAFYQTPEGITAAPFAFESLVADGKGGWSYGKHQKLTGAPKEFSGDYMPDVRGLLVSTGELSAILLLAGRQSLYRFDATTLAYIDSLAWPKSERESGTTVNPAGAKPAKTSNSTNIVRSRLPASLHLMPGRNLGPNRLVVADPFSLRLIELK